MVVCSLASGLSFGSTPTGVMATLCFFCFWLGLSIGGDYPLSATIMSEYANKKTRGRFIAAVFAMQGFGILAGVIVTPGTPSRPPPTCPGCCRWRSRRRRRSWMRLPAATGEDYGLRSETRKERRELGDKGQIS